MTNANETAEPSGASAGSHPVAWQLWGDESDDGPFDHYITERSAHWDAERLRHENPAKKWFVVPLYRQPQPTLTDDERAALWCAVCDYNSMTRTLDMPKCGKIGPALASLFERLK
jgi:hypothetical protein